jgi:hypothetical protein
MVLYFPHPPCSFFSVFAASSPCTSLHAGYAPVYYLLHLIVSSSHTLLDPQTIPTPRACCTGNEHRKCLRVGGPGHCRIPSTTRGCARLHGGCHHASVAALSNDIYNLLEMYRNNRYATTSNVFHKPIPRNTSITTILCILNMFTRVLSVKV